MLLRRNQHKEVWRHRIEKGWSQWFQIPKEIGRVRNQNKVEELALSNGWSSQRKKGGREGWREGQGGRRAG